VRDDVLSTAIADIGAFAEVADAIARQGRLVVIGAKAQIEAASRAPGAWAAHNGGVAVKNLMKILNKRWRSRSDRSPAGVSVIAPVSRVFLEEWR
jgi:hypothetical protein